MKCLDMSDGQNLCSTSDKTLKSHCKFLFLRFASNLNLTVVNAGLHSDK